MYSIHLVKAKVVLSCIPSKKMFRGPCPCCFFLFPLKFVAAFEIHREQYRNHLSYYTLLLPSGFLGSQPDFSNAFSKAQTPKRGSKAMHRQKKSARVPNFLQMWRLAVAAFRIQPKLWSQPIRPNGYDQIYFRRERSNISLSSIFVLSLTGSFSF